MESSRLKSEFVANMTHEIRTPLHVMVGLMEILCSREQHADQARCYAMLQSSIDRLSSLVNNVLDFSRMASGAFELSPRLFSLSVLVETLVRTYAPDAKSKGLLLTVDIDDKLPDMLFADDVRLGQVLGIIIDNAVKFTHSGNICMALQSAEETRFQSPIRFPFFVPFRILVSVSTLIKSTRCLKVLRRLTVH